MAQASISDAPDATRRVLAPRPDRLPELDSLRGIAALLVMFHHACLSCWHYPEVTITPALAPWLSWLKYGHFCVTLFIVLSGFVIMRPLVRDLRVDQPRREGRWRQFFRRRARRILPPYFVALVCSIALLVRFHGWKSVTLPDFLGHLFLIHDWGVGRAQALNGPMWSIPVEWHIYFTVPLLFLAWKKIGPGLTAVAGLVVTYGFFALISAPALRDSIAPHFYGIFALGGAAAYLANEIQTRRQSSTWPVGMIVLVLAATWVATTFLGSWQWYLAHYAWCDLTFAAFAAALLVFLATRESTFRRFLRWPALVQLGGMSYSLYLVHGPLLTYFDGKFTGKHGIAADRKFALLCLIACPIILALAYVFHRLFERPFLTQSHRTTPTATPGQAAEISSAVWAATEKKSVAADLLR